MTTEDVRTPEDKAVIESTPPPHMASMSASPNVQTDDARANLQVQKLEFHRAVSSAAQWFYWITGLSLVNTIILHAGGDIHFPVGLGVTQAIDVLFKDYLASISTVGIVASIILAGIYIIFGYFGVKRHAWAFITGMTLYALDALLLLVVVQDWIGVGFHALALYFIFKGYKCLKPLQSLEDSASPTPLMK